MNTDEQIAELRQRVAVLEEAEKIHTWILRAIVATAFIGGSVAAAFIILRKGI